MKKFFRNHKWQLTTLSLLAIIALLASMITISPSAVIKKQWGNVITIGSEVSASTTADFTATGTAAQQTATFQTALNDLPSSGGILNILSGTFTFNATVTRAIANVTIEGIGSSTIFQNNASTPIFTAGGNGWNFEGFVTDAGGVSVGSYTYFESNLSVNGTIYNASSPVPVAPTGRTASYVIAASNSSTTDKAQADAVCSGSADQTIINAHAMAGHVILLAGDYYVTAYIAPVAGEWLDGEGTATIIHQNYGSLYGSAINVKANNVTISNLYIDGMFGTYGNQQGWGLVFSGNTTVSPYTNNTAYNITSNNAQGFGIGGVGGQLNSLTNLNVYNCVVTNSAQANMDFIGVDYGNIHDNYCTTTANSWANIDLNSLYNCNVSKNTCISASSHGISCDGGNNVNISDNTIINPTSNSMTFIQTGTLYTGWTGCIVTGNSMIGDTNGGILFENLTEQQNTVLVNNSGSGYFVSGQMFTVKVPINAVAQNAVAFAWHNPYNTPIWITRAEIYTGYSAGVAGCTLEVAYADDASGTNIGQYGFYLFTAVNLATDTYDTDDSYHTADTGAQVKYQMIQASSSGSKSWVVGIVQNAASTGLTGAYIYFTYIVQ